MAHSNNSAIVGKISGTINKELVFRDMGDITVVSKSPKKRKGELPLAVQEMKEKFLIAVDYANAVIKRADQALAEDYAEKLKPRQSVYRRAVEDFLTVPKIVSFTTREYTGAVGSTISVRALDDFRVVRVRFEIYTPDGTLLEFGNAALDENGSYWVYTATQLNNQVTGSKVKAIAFDIPKNEGESQITL